jgi:hypothetical protein
MRALRRAGTGHVRSIKRMKSTQDIVESIDTRLEELAGEINTLSAARSALDAPPRQPLTQSSRRATKRRARATSPSPRARASASSPHETSRKASRGRTARSRDRTPATARPTAHRANGATTPERLEALLSDQRKAASQPPSSPSGPTGTATRCSRCSEISKPPARSAEPVNAAERDGTRSQTRTASASASQNSRPAGEAQPDTPRVNPGRTSYTISKALAAPSAPPLARQGVVRFWRRPSSDLSYHPTAHRQSRGHGGAGHDRV